MTAGPNLLIYTKQDELTAYIAVGDWEEFGFYRGKKRLELLVVMQGMAPVASLYRQGGGKLCWDDCHGDWSVPRILGSARTHRPDLKQTNV